MSYKLLKLTRFYGDILWHGKSIVRMKNWNSRLRFKKILRKAIGDSSRMVQNALLSYWKKNCFWHYFLWQCLAKKLFWSKTSSIVIIEQNSHLTSLAHTQFTGLLLGSKKCHLWEKVEMSTCTRAYMSDSPVSWYHQCW